MPVPSHIKSNRRQAAHDAKRVPLTSQVDGAMVKATCNDLAWARSYAHRATYYLIESRREANPIDASADMHEARKAIRRARRYVYSARIVNSGTLGPDWSGWLP